MGSLLLLDSEPGRIHPLRRALAAVRLDMVVANDRAEAKAQLEQGEVEVLLVRSLKDAEETVRVVAHLDAQRPDLPKVVEIERLEPELFDRLLACEGVMRIVAGPAPPHALVGAVLHAVERGAAHRDFLAWREGSAHRGELDRHLAEAIATVNPHWQPLVRAETEQVHGFEVLARTGPDCALRRPDDLFRTAIERGRLHELERAMRERVAARLEELPETLEIFVNVHPGTLLDEAFLLGDEPLVAHARRVVLEITEHQELERHTDLEARVQKLRHQGYRLALDDFGSGSAGLRSYLKIQPEIVKFDRGLVAQVPGSAAGRQLLRSLNELFHAFGSRTVAEGIETEEQQRQLTELGCDLLQGWHLGRPQPEPEIAVLTLAP